MTVIKPSREYLERMKTKRAWIIRFVVGYIIALTIFLVIAVGSLAHMIVTN